MTKSLPPRPNLQHLKDAAKSLLKAHRAGDASCCEVLRNLKELQGRTDAEVLASELSLTSVQHALAIAYGFPTWAAMKLEVLGRTDKFAFLHLLCGDISGRILRNSSVPGDVQVWMENFVEGPVPVCGSEEEWRWIRSRYIASLFSDATVEGVYARSHVKYERLAEGRNYREVLLWFDACLFDQTIMIHLIDRLSRLDLGDAKLSLICPGDFPGFDVFHGFALLTPEQMASLLDTRHEITDPEIALARAAWAAFSSADPTDLETLLAGDCSALPYLGAALARFLEQYPSAANGLSRTEQEVMAAVAGGAQDAGAIWGRARDMEERPYFGDTTIIGVIEELARAPTPLLTVDGLDDMAARNKVDKGVPSNAEMKKWRVGMTDAGHAVLGGKQDHIRLNGIDRWLGGVHLQGAEAQWRWDDEGKHLVAAGRGNVASPQRKVKTASQVGPVGRLNDDVRAKLSVAKIEQICRLHGLPKPVRITPEPDGNDAVVYYLDTTAVLSFHCHRKIFTEIHEGLRIMEGFDEFPSPRLIAIEEEDDDLGMPYIIAERCPGERLDRLWVRSGHPERLDIAKALGEGMARYHKIDIGTFRSRTRAVSLEHRAGYEVKTNTQTYRTNVQKIAERVSRTFEVISALGLDCATIARHVESHLAQCMTKEWRPFAGIGLCHEGAWPDHLFIRQTGPGPVLSGCIDFEEFPFADSLGELGTLYCSILGTDDSYVDAFIGGYRKYFDLPADAAQRMREEAIEEELGCLDHMTKGIEIDSSSLTWREKPVADWLKRWISHRCDRLEGWFDQAKRVTKPLFRGQVGPW